MRLYFQIVAISKLQMGTVRGTKNKNVKRYVWTKKKRTNFVRTLLIHSENNFSARLLRTVPVV